MTTDVLERPSTLELVETEEKTENGPPQIRHYFNKEQTDAAIFAGAPVKALCGFVKPEIPNFRATGPICEKCQWLYENVVGSNRPPEDRE